MGILRSRSKLFAISIRISGCFICILLACSTVGSHWQLYFNKHTNKKYVFFSCLKNALTQQKKRISIRLYDYINNRAISVISSKIICTVKKLDANFLNTFYSHINSNTMLSQHKTASFKPAL